MLRRKPLEEISDIDAGWLKAKHHFAMGPYGNPTHKPVGNLIVLNDDEIAPRSGFDFHHHKDVEIVSYLREGTVTHRDDQGNIGNSCRGRPGDERRNGHCSFRAERRKSSDSPFQIWLKSLRAGGAPQWGTKPFPKVDRAGVLVPLASGRNAEGALPIRADAEVYGALLRVARRQAIPSARAMRRTWCLQQVI